MTEPADDTQPLVHITTMQGQDYEDAVDAINDHGGSVDAAIEHLAQWDQGAETDADSVAYHGLYSLEQIRRLPHSLHEGVCGEIRYWLLIDHPLGLYSLYRAPLSPVHEV